MSKHKVTVWIPYHRVNPALWHRFDKEGSLDMTIATPRIPVAAASGVPTSGFTAEDWEAWAVANDIKIELVDGNLTLMTPPPAGHGRLVMKIAGWLIQQGINPEVIGIDDGLSIGNNVRVPDLILMREPPQPTLMRVHPDDVILVVEVESPSTLREDRTAKLAEYEAAHILEYWIVSGADDPDRAEITAYRLHNDSYEIFFRGALIAWLTFTYQNPEETP